MVDDNAELCCLVHYPVLGGRVAVRLDSDVVKKHVYEEHVEEEDKRLISKAEKMGLLPIIDKIDEATAHSKNLRKLVDKLGKLC